MEFRSFLAPLIHPGALPARDTISASMPDAHARPAAALRAMLDFDRLKYAVTRQLCVGGNITRTTDPSSMLSPTPQTPQRHPTVV